MQYLRTATKVLAIVAAVTVSVSAAAADLKVGVVDTTKLLRMSPQGQNANDQLSKKFDSRKKELMSENEKIKSMQEDLDKNGAVMSASQAQDEQTRLEEMQRDFNRKQSEYTDDVTMEQNEVLSKLQQEALKAVQEVAQIQKFNLILSTGVLYADNSVDITDLVLAQMQKDYKAESAKSGG